MKGLHLVSWILLVVGGLNWLLVGVANLNLVEYLGSPLAKIVYILVGIGALVELFTHKKNCKCCVTSSNTSPSM